VGFSNKRTRIYLYTSKTPQTPSSPPRSPVTITAVIFLLRIRLSASLSLVLAVTVTGFRLAYLDTGFCSMSLSLSMALRRSPSVMMPLGFPSSMMTARLGSLAENREPTRQIAPALFYFHPSMGSCGKAEFGQILS